MMTYLKSRYDRFGNPVCRSLLLLMRYGGSKSYAIEFGPLGRIISRQEVEEVEEIQGATLNSSVRL